MVQLNRRSKVQLNRRSESTTKPLSGDGTCGSSNKGMEKSSEEGLGFVHKEFVSAPVEAVVTRGSEKCSYVNPPNDFSGIDFLGLYDFADDTRYVFTEPDQRDEIDESDGRREVREREGIPDLDSDSDDHGSLIRKNQKNKNKKKNVEESSSIAEGIGEVDERDVKSNVEESSSIANLVGEVDKSNVEASHCNGEADDSNEASTPESATTPEIVDEVRRSDEEACDEANESSSSSSSFSETSGSGLNDLRNVVEKINSICEETVTSNSEVSELLEVSIQQQPLGSQVKGFASRGLGSSENSARSLSMTLEELYMWEKKLYAEVTAEEKLRFLHDKGYNILRNLDQTGAEWNEIYEAEAVVILNISHI